MTDEISMDRIVKMLHEITGFKADASQIDAVRVTMEAYAAQLAQSYVSSPSELTEAHLHSLVTLASQLLDTGGRMRLHPEGQLDVPVASLATQADVQALARTVQSLSKDRVSKQDLAAATARHDLTGVLGRLDDLDEYVGDRFTSMNAQLESLTATVLAAQAPASPSTFEDWVVNHIGKLSNAVDDALFALKAGGYQSAAVPSDDASAASMMLPTGTGIDPVEWDRMDSDAVRANEALRQEAVDESLRIIAGLRDDRDQIRVVHKKQDQDRPGCFFNDDGTITCRDCQTPKPPSEYYRDKRAWTGHKAACKDCERQAKQLARPNPVF